MYLAWDVDLLRVAAVWKAKGDPFTNAGMAANSYPYLFKKVSGGQGKLPLPNGKIWYDNGIYPGVKRFPDVPERNGGIRDLSYKVWEGTKAIPAHRKPSYSGVIPSGLIDVDLGGMEEQYSMIFEGQLAVPVDGDYTFSLSVDNVGTLYLDGKEVLKTGREDSVTLKLDAGDHPLRVDFNESGGGQSLSLIWSGPGFEGRHLSLPADFSDPRLPQPDPEEPGRGGLDSLDAGFTGIDLRDGVSVEYQFKGTEIRERFRLSKEGVVRHLEIGPHSHGLDFVVASRADDNDFACHGPGEILRMGFNVVCRVPASDCPQEVAIFYKPAEGQPGVSSRGPQNSKRWPWEVRLPIVAATEDGAFSIETLPLPSENPSGRAVRNCGIDFFGDGRAAMVTFDGDVWIGDGFRPASKEIVWSRFATGLHEPLDLKIRDGAVFVFDRNGIWELQDRDNNGEADYHRLFCQKILQTAETREFASGMELEKDGSFLVCKPGQNASGHNRESGTILRISRDGKTVTTIAEGLRQPFLGLDPKTGQIAVSDQQGNWVPSTPVYFTRQGDFYGHPTIPAHEGRPVTEPLLWLPHEVCASSASVIWTRGTKLGALNDQAILVSFNPPGLFLLHQDIDPVVAQGAATKLDLPMDTMPVLKAAVNPADGLLYVSGFKIWGTVSTGTTVLARVRANPAAHSTLPTQARAERRGILLEFATPLDPAVATKLEAYTVRRWNYRRTAKYGSANYKLDGAVGVDELPTASVKLSKDSKSVFIGVPGMQEAMQIEVGYELATAAGTPISRKTYLTSHLLRTLDLSATCFADNEVNLDVQGLPTIVAKTPEPTLAMGEQLYTQLGCLACHSIDGTTAGKTGPSWLGLFGSKRKLVGNGQVVVADKAYLRESILDPTAKVAEGAVNGEAGMPIYAGVLNPVQVESLLLFIQSLSTVR